MLNVKVSNKLHNKWPRSGNKEVLASAQVRRAQQKEHLHLFRAYHRCTHSFFLQKRRVVNKHLEIYEKRLAMNDLG